MKKRSLFVMAVLMIALLSTSFTAVSAKPNTSRPVECIINITNDLTVGDFWFGTVSGCSVEGTIKFEHGEKENYIVGKTGHFFEVFTIWPASGGEIKGIDEGVWNFSTFKFRANGWVTSASEDWAYLIGYKFHEIGTTSNPEEVVVTAPGTKMKLAPASRAPQGD